MTHREEKVKELMEILQSLKHHRTFRSVECMGLPRITPAQWGVLMRIEELGTSTVKGVAADLGITSSAATQLIDGLVTSDYVIREINKQDRRTVVVSLSKRRKRRWKR